jgi:hypothetical protein
MSPALEAYRLDTADSALLERVITESGVDATATETGWLEAWLEAVGEQLRRWLASFLELFDGVSAATSLPPWLGWGLLALLLLAAAALLLRGLGRAPRSEVPALPPTSNRAPLEPRSAREWRAAIEAALARGELEVALAALWWWLACRLAPREAQSSWTTRELVLQSGRRDLAPLVARFDALAYGPLPPAPGEVKGLLGELEERLA